MRCPRGFAAMPQASAWGGIASAFDVYKRERIANFNNQIQRITALLLGLSTENLLLNAYRQMLWGLPTFFAANALYRLTQERTGVHPVITTNLAMQTKTIAFGIISHEHHKAQMFILGNIKAELVERLIK